MAVSYTRLRDGSWGLRATEPVRSGQEVTVKKKSGETKAETVGKILWSGDGVTLATIRPAGPRRAAPEDVRRPGVREEVRARKARRADTVGDAAEYPFPPWVNRDEDESRYESRQHDLDAERAAEEDAFLRDEARAAAEYGPPEGF